MSEKCPTCKQALPVNVIVERVKNHAYVANFWTDEVRPDGLTAMQAAEALISRLYKRWGIDAQIRENTP
jgi:hypothetical protein